MVCKKLILFIIIFLFLVFIYLRFKTKNIEHLVNIKPIDGKIKWYRPNTCKNRINRTLESTLKTNSIEQTNSDDWVIYLPCSYNKISNEIKEINLPKKQGQHNRKRIFIVNNADELTGKNTLWDNLVKTYGRKKSCELMPTTYLLNSPSDLLIFNKEYKKDNIYILKKNIQRQQGLLITKNYWKIMNGFLKGYVVAQKLLQDPYLINGRKINMRFYLLFVCQNNEVSAYVHKEGFMYYTKDLFKKGTIDDGPNITTGYIDRSVYEENPLTHGDFRKYLDNPVRDLAKVEKDLFNNGVPISLFVFNKIYNLLIKVVDSVKHTICMNSKVKEYVTFQLFGADIAINDKLEPQIIEINKGPDMGSKGSRDKEIKNSVMNDILKVLKIIPDNKNDYIKIVE
jgi:hypothetical protein